MGYLILAINTSITAIIGGIIAHNFRKMQDKSEQRHQEQFEKEYLLITGVLSNIELSQATAIAIKDGKCNGEIDKALKKSNLSKTEIEEFYRRQGVRRNIG